MLPVPTLASLALLLPAQDPAQQPAGRSLLEAVPADAVIVVAVEDVPTLWERARASAWAEVLRDPVFAPAWEWLDGALAEDLVPGKLTAAELVDAIGSAVLYLGRLVDGEPTEGSLAVRLQPGRPRVREVLALELEAAGALVEHGGRDVMLAEPDEEDDWTAALDWRDGFVLSWAPERERALAAAVTLADRLEQGASDGGFAARLAGLQPHDPAALSLHIHAGAFAPREGDGTDEGDLALAQLLGLDELGWASLRATIGEGVATDVEWRVTLSRPGLPAAGLIPRWASCAQPLPVELARLAPADAVAVSVAGYDVEAAWRQLREAFPDALPDGAAQFEAALHAARETAGVDLEQDLLAQLTGEFAEFLLPTDGMPLPERVAGGMGLLAMSPILLGFSGFPATSPGSVLVVGLRETGPVEDLLEALVEVAGAGELLEDEQVGGRWMTCLRSPDFPLHPAWAFVDDALLFSLQPEPVRAVLAQATADAPPSWLDGEGHREALGEEGAAFVATVADLEPLLQSQVVDPLETLLEILAQAELLGGPEAAAEEGTAAEWMARIAAALPELVTRHLQGRMRKTIAFDGRVMRQRVWTE